MTLKTFLIYLLCEVKIAEFNVIEINEFWLTALLM